MTAGVFRRLAVCLLTAGAILPSTALAYPLFGSEELGIRRLEITVLAHEGKIRGAKRLPGELLSRDQVDLRLSRQPDLKLPAVDAAFAREIVKLLGDAPDRYSVAVLDLSDPEHIRYAEHNGVMRRSPGSVGKLVGALGLFQALADIYPDDHQKRMALLRETWITADDFIIYDHHKVRLWEPEKKTLSIRPLKTGDRGSLWDFLDWMLSASSNAAAAMVMKEAMLLRHYGRDYPVAAEESERFFKETPRRTLANLYVKTFHEPLTRSGIDLESFRQGSFFTRAGKQKVPGTTSYATSRELMRFILRMEQGRLVDEFTSRELKRLLYVTERRIRYASSPALRDAAVYFKSGSLYSCQPEAGFKCRKYQGNKKNLMNSVAIVESPAGAPRLFYMVTMTSNVLRRNSAEDHQALGTLIHRLLERDHGKKATD